MSYLKVLVYEYATSEGYLNKSVSPGILSEGFGMLNGLVSDFEKAGHQVTTILANKLKNDLSIKAGTISWGRSQKDSRKKLRKFANLSDAVLVIAPESRELLQNLVEIVKESGATSLNSTPEAINIISNKILAYLKLSENNLPVPKSKPAEISKNMDRIKKISEDLKFPLVFKPVDGVGCGGLSIVKNRPQIPPALEKVRNESKKNQFIIQEYVEGTPVSVILFSTGRRAKPIILNLQNVKLEPPKSNSEYLGGATPFHHPLEEKTLKMAKKAVETFKNLRGYVGVDLILTDQKPVIMEINPRFTTSYIGARKVLELNLAQATLNVALRKKLPKKTKSIDCVFFSKITLPASLTPEIRRKFFEAKEIISPPFPMSGNSCMIVLAHAKNLNLAQSKFEKIKKSIKEANK